MSELFSNENIFINVSVGSQNEAIEKAGQVDSGVVENYIQAMKDREDVVSTFMGNGLAIHMVLKKLKVTLSNQV